MWYQALGDRIGMDPAASLHQNPMQAFQFFIEIQRFEFKTVPDLVVYSVNRVHAQSNN